MTKNVTLPNLFPLSQEDCRLTRAGKRNHKLVHQIAYSYFNICAVIFESKGCPFSRRSGIRVIIYQEIFSKISDVGKELPGGGVLYLSGRMTTTLTARIARGRGLGDNQFEWLNANHEVRGIIKDYRRYSCINDSIRDLLAYDTNFRSSIEKNNHGLNVRREEQLVVLEFFH